MSGKFTAGASVALHQPGAVRVVHFGESGVGGGEYRQLSGLIQQIHVLCTQHWNSIDNQYADPTIYFEKKNWK